MISMGSKVEEYIKKYQDKGISDKAIIEKLVKTGYSEDKIKHYFEKEPEAVEEAGTEPKGNTGKILIISLSVLVVVLIVIFGIKLLPERLGAEEAETFPSGMSPEEIAALEEAALEEEFRIFELQVGICEDGAAFANEESIIRCIALANKDPEICNNINGTEEQIGACKDIYYEIRIAQTYDTSFCPLFTNEQKKELCFAMDNPCMGADPNAPSDECIAFGEEFCRNFKYSVGYSVASDEANQVICEELFSEKIDPEVCESLNGADRALCFRFLLYHKAITEMDIDAAIRRASIEREIDSSINPGIEIMAYISGDESWCKIDTAQCTRSKLLAALRRGVFNITLTCDDCADELNFLDNEDCNFIKSADIKEACLASI